jgi:excisionase family DNA binding protein
MNESRLFTRDEAASHLSVTTRTLDRAVVAGKLKPVWVGTAKRFRASDVDALISEAAPPISPNLGPKFGFAKAV